MFEISSTRARIDLAGRSLCRRDKFSPRAAAKHFAITDERSFAILKRRGRTKNLATSKNTRVQSAKNNSAIARPTVSRSPGRREFLLLHALRSTRPASSTLRHLVPSTQVLPLDSTLAALSPSPSTCRNETRHRAYTTEPREERLEK